MNPFLIKELLELLYLYTEKERAILVVSLFFDIAMNKKFYPGGYIK